jgi:hypothetical protein
MAKLRMHTDKTLSTLDSVTTSLGNSMHNFVSKTCAGYETKELQREATVRKKRLAKRNDQAKGKGGKLGSCKSGR